MATLEQRQEAMKLINGGLTPEEAAKRVRANSVTNQAGDTSVLSNKEMKMRETNLARQAEPLATETTTTTTPVVPETTVTPAPVTPPVVTPPPVTPVEQPKATTTEAPKLEPVTNIAQLKQSGTTVDNLQELINNRYGTQSEIVGNGVEAVINGEKVIWTFDKNGNPTKKSLGKTTEGVSEMVKAGMDVPPELKNTVEYKQATDLQSQVSLYKNMSSGDLSYALSQGNILPGTELYKELERVNPTALAEAQKLANLNSAFTKQSSAEELKTTITEKLLNSFSGDVENYKTILSQNPEVVKINEKMTEKNGELAELKDQLEYLYDDLETELKGRGATKSYINAKYGERSQELTRQYNLKLNEYNTLAGNLERISEDVKYEIELRKQGQQQEMDKLSFLYGVASDELGYERGLEAEKRAEEAQTRQLEQKYAYDYGDLNSTNPTLQNIAIERAVAGMYQNYPIPGMESQATKVQKIQNLIAQGMTGSEAIAQVESEIRNSQRYKDYIASTKPTQEPVKPIEVGGVTYTLNPSTNQYEAVSQPTGSVSGDLRGLASQFPGQAWAKNNNPAGITWNANFDNPTPGSTAQRLIDAGIQYSKGTSRPASEGGNYVTFNTIEDGLKAQRIMMSGTYGNSTVGQMLQKWVGTSEGPNYAKQVAGNAGIDINTKVSDLSDMELEQLQYAKIQKESPGLYKLLTEDNSNMQMQALSLVQGLGGTADERQTFADNVIKVAQRDNISLADAKKKLGYKSGDDTEFAKSRKEDYQSFKKTINESTSNAKTALTLLSQPQTAIGDVASIVGFLKTIDPASVARESEVASVESARGILDSLSNVFTKAKEGTKLTPTQREQLTSSIQTIVNASDSKYNDYVTDLVTEFNDRGLDASVYIPKTEVEKVIKGQSPKGTTPTQQTGTTGTTPATVNYGGKTYNFKPR